MHLRAFGLVVGVVAVVVGGCTSSGATTPPASQAGASQSPAQAGQLLPSTAVASPAPSAAPRASPSASPAAGGSLPSGSPTAIDPCTLLTNEQAGMVNGGTYGDGTKHVLGPAALCVRQSSTSNGTLTISVTVSPSSTAAQAHFAAFKASLKAEGLTDVAGIGDSAFIGRATTISTGGIYVLKGAVIFYVVYLLGAEPTDQVLKDAATIIVGELP